MTDRADGLRRFVRIMGGSEHCCSGIVHVIGKRCECRRCRESRGEPWSEATELQAAQVQEEARAALRRDG